MVLKDFINWLTENFPQDAVIVRTNSFSWFSREVEDLNENDLKHMFFLKQNPEKGHKPVNEPCLVLKDDRYTDY